MSVVSSNGAAPGRGRGSGLMRLHWAVISVMSDSCQRQQQGDTKWRRLSSYPWRRRQRWRRRRHLLQAAAACSFSGSGSAPGRRRGGGARPGLSPTPRIPRGRRLGGRGAEGGGGSGACDAPPTGLCARVTAGPLGVRLPLSVTVGGGGKGRRDRPRPSAGPPGQGAGLDVEGAGRYPGGGGARVVGRRGFGGVF